MAPVAGQMFGLVVKACPDVGGERVRGLGVGRRGLGHCCVDYRFLGDWWIVVKGIGGGDFCVSWE